MSAILPPEPKWSAWRAAGSSTQPVRCATLAHALGGDRGKGWPVGSLFLPYPSPSPGPCTCMLRWYRTKTPSAHSFFAGRPTLSAMICAGIALPSRHCSSQALAPQPGAARPLRPAPVRMPPRPSTVDPREDREAKQKREVTRAAMETAAGGAGK